MRKVSVTYPRPRDRNVGDGYEIARELERSCHWDCNMQVVEERYG